MAHRDALHFPHYERAWLDEYLPPIPTENASTLNKPFVTLTFATSMDSALAIAPGVQTALSGPQSKAMTHYLRSRHDAILIGVSTALIDNPSLNCRLQGVGGYGGLGLEGQPRPIVIDPHAKWDIVRGTKVVQLASEGRGKAPWIVTTRPPAADKAFLLNAVGGEYIVLSAMSNTSATLAWDHVLQELARRKLSSVMIEGGATVINSLLTEAELIDSVIVTVAPVWLGSGSVTVLPKRWEAPGPACLPIARLQQPRWHQLGDDVVLCGRIK